MSRLFHIETGKAIERIMQQFRSRFGHHPYRFFMCNRHDTALMNSACSTRNFSRFVANAFQISNGFDRCHHGAQVIRCRLALNDEMTTGVV